MSNPFVTGKKAPSKPRRLAPRERDVANDVRYDSSICVRCGGPRDRHRGPICDLCSPERHA